MSLSRRLLLAGLGAGAATVAAHLLADRWPAADPELSLEGAPAPYRPSPSASFVTRAPADVRRLAVQCLHTGEKLQAVYYENGAYVPDALAEAARVLRDWRTGDSHAMDPRLFDIMDGLSRRLQTRAPFRIVCGYRSAKTNAMLHARSAGVARDSLHMLGEAIDLRLDGVDLARLHEAALDLAAGGVGFYPASGFVHLDVGRVRSWTGS